MRRVRGRFWILLFVTGAACLLLLWWLQNLYVEPEYAWLEDGLAVGSSVKTPPRGTKAVVNLCGREDPYKVEASLWEPILEGGPEPDLPWLERVIAFIDEQRGQGRPVYIHCLAGVNRSGMVATAYLMHAHGWPRDKALAYVRSKRPQISPGPNLLRLLEEYEASQKQP